LKKVRGFLNPYKWNNTMLNVILGTMQKDFKQWKAKVFGRRSKAIKGISLSDSGIAD